MKQNTKWFSIVIALGLTLFLSLIGLYLMEYAVPFARQVKGVENASSSYYEAYSGIEIALLDIGQKKDAWDLSSSIDKSFSWSQDFEYASLRRGQVFPMAGQWDAIYDSSKMWNQMSYGKSISLLVWNGELSGWSYIRLFTRLPLYDWQGSAETLASGNTDTILWQLTTPTTTYSSKDLFDINVDGTPTGGSGYFNIWNSTGIQQWESRSAPWQLFSTIYTNQCNTSGQQCILSLSYIKPLSTSDNSLLPYLEYRLETTTGNNFIYPSIYLSSTGRSYGYVRDLHIFYPQYSNNTAFEYAVFQ